MKKRLLLVVAFAALLSLGLFGVSTPAARTVKAQGRSLIGFQNQASLTAMAQFTQPLSGGATRSVQVFASRGRLQTAPGKPMRDAGSVGVSVVEGTLPFGPFSFAAFGQVNVPGFVIDNQLSGAHLPVTTVNMEVFDPTTGMPTGDTFPLQLEVTWTGTGAVTISHGVTHMSIPGGMELTRGNGKERAATAVANQLTFTKPGGASVNMSGVNAVNAGLSNRRFMDLIIASKSEG